jgi:hypothetical protein
MDTISEIWGTVWVSDDVPVSRSRLPTVGNCWLASITSSEWSGCLIKLKRAQIFGKLGTGRYLSVDTSMIHDPSRLLEGKSKMNLGISAAFHLVLRDRVIC